MNKANQAIIKDTLKEIIEKAANAHADKYVDRYKKVAYDSFLCGMEEMSALMSGRVSLDDIIKS